MKVGDQGWNKAGSFFGMTKSDLIGDTSVILGGLDFSQFFVFIQTG
jgi:hypothetical protein